MVSFSLSLSLSSPYWRGLQLVCFLSMQVEYVKVMKACLHITTCPHTQTLQVLCICYCDPFFQHWWSGCYKLGDACMPLVLAHPISLMAACQKTLVVGPSGGCFFWLCMAELCKEVKGLQSGLQDISCEVVVLQVARGYVATLVHCSAHMHDTHLTLVCCCLLSMYEDFDFQSCTWFFLAWSCYELNLYTSEFSRLFG